jgi:phosphatidylglycerol:prolipoprotein diacylglycerol transferase
VFYAISFLIGYFYVKLLIKKNKWQKVDEKFLDDFLFFVMLGVLVGGRLGYVFFYNFSYFLHYPWKVFFIRE